MCAVDAITLNEHIRNYSKLNGHEFVSTPVAAGSERLDIVHREEALLPVAAAFPPAAVARLQHLHKVAHAEPQLVFLLGLVTETATMIVSVTVIDTTTIDTVLTTWSNRASTITTAGSATAVEGGGGAIATAGGGGGADAPSLSPLMLAPPRDSDSGPLPSVLARVPLALVAVTTALQITVKLATN